MDFKTCPVEIYQSEAEFEWLLKTVNEVKPVNVVEIGSLLGGTMWFWINDCPSIKHIVSIDVVVGPSDKRYAQQKAGHDGLWLEWATKQGKTLHVLECASQSKIATNSVKKFFPQGIDFLFIDGAHDETSVRNDFSNYAPLVKDGGLVAFHDIDYNKESGYYGVKPVWETLKRLAPELTSQMIVKPGDRGIGIYRP